MKDVGKEAVTDLRKVVKQTLSDAIQKPIRGACERFVHEGNDIGTGVKSRILGLFETLAKQATKAAEGPAQKILQENFVAVRGEVRTAFDSWGDPLEETVEDVPGSAFYDPLQIIAKDRLVDASNNKAIVT